jgi:arylsulfatase A-like enzyme
MRGSRTPRLRILAAFLSAIPILAACQRDDPPSADPPRVSQGLETPPNILLVAACTFRYDHLGAAGYDRPTTPFLDSFAERGVFFENAVSASSWTQPAMASLLTGLTPNVHGMTVYHDATEIAQRRISPERLLADEVVTLAESLRNAGYQTFARIANVQAGDFFNIPQGFDDSLTRSGLAMPAMLDELRAWLGARRMERPFFAFLLPRDLHFVHEPAYDHYLRFNRSPEAVAESDYADYPTQLYHRVRKELPVGVPPELQRAYVDLYDAALAEFDDAVRSLPDLLKAAGVERSTIVVITGDHGERFFEKGGMSHAGDLDEVVVRVPLIMVGPGLPRQRRIPDVVRSIDVYPTLAEIAEAEAPRILQGISLWPFLAAPERRFPELSAFASFSRGSTLLHMVGTGRHKLHSGGRLYDVALDPYEARNLYRESPELARSMKKQLKEWLASEEALREKLAEGPTRELTPEMIGELRALGYVE